jgi:nicotinate phosphoribosyltransferase
MEWDEKQFSEGILYTDFYELTMAQMYYRNGIHEQPALFDYFFRSYPDYSGHQAGYCIFAGLQWLVQWMQRARFGDREIEFLRSQTGRAGKPLFDDSFLQWLKHNGNFDGIQMSAIPEGRVVHPAVPLITVTGPLAMAQILESSLLNRCNFQTLIATKASRIKHAGQNNVLIDFGMRRAQDTASLAAVRAALIGGADFSSNTGISAILGYPPKGTHAHSMVQAFMALGAGELEAFRAYAECYPDDCLLLVDTVNTLHSGVPNAIRVFEELRDTGHSPLGIRLDSGDLAYLSIQSARMLDKAGFDNTVIVLSNAIDEMVLMQIIDQIREEAPRYGMDAEKIIGRLSYGVGTKMVTSGGAGALDGVYKLTGLAREGRWVLALKVSETPEKILNPGKKRFWRVFDTKGTAIVDCLSMENEDMRTMDTIELRHPVLSAQRQTLKKDAVGKIEELHRQILRNGTPIYDFPSIDQIRKVRQRDRAALDQGVKRIINPHVYHVSLTNRLWKQKQELVAEVTGQ